MRPPITPTYLLHDPSPGGQSVLFLVKKQTGGFKKYITKTTCVERHEEASKPPLGDRFRGRRRYDVVPSSVGRGEGAGGATSATSRYGGEGSL